MPSKSRSSKTGKSKKSTSDESTRTRKAAARSTKKGASKGATKAVTKSVAKGAKKGASKRRVARGLFGTPVKFVQPASVDASDNLDRIEHIVVLMLENRSFDHMLGYLKLEGAMPDVNGLSSEMNNSYGGKKYKIMPLTNTVFKEDPCHEGDCVEQQLSNDNGGFVANFAEHHPASNPNLIMGYYNGALLPVYDYLARNFCICDQWFCSVPGATWPNRLYAVTGRADGKKDNKFPPVYNLPSFVRHLDAARVSWRWYAHDMASLRLTDRKYSIVGNYFWFDRKTTFKRENFLDHAASGDLAAVSWIDPNFADYHVTGPADSNDDHPPSDVMAGQDLVFKLFNAVVSSPAWSKTLLIIVYDEHGGFYDHVQPPAAPDDKPAFRRFGARVPAIIVSPFVGSGVVSHMQFDHTSIIKTILLRFCQRPDGTIPDMGARVNNANHLGHLLTLDAPRAPIAVTAYQSLIERVAQWRGEVFKKKTMLQAARSPQVHRLTDFQQGLLAARKRLEAEGLPEDQP
ncbi:MAG TPA: alkaline phosphatase family protein [Pyrinomonadaceae bacterium]|jgi:phospholipase C